MYCVLFCFNISAELIWQQNWSFSVEFIEDGGGSEEGWALGRGQQSTCNGRPSTDSKAWGVLLTSLHFLSPPSFLSNWDGLSTLPAQCRSVCLIHSEVRVVSPQPRVSFDRGDPPSQIDLATHCGNLLHYLAEGILAARDPPYPF